MRRDSVQGRTEGDFIFPTVSSLLSVADRRGNNENAILDNHKRGALTYYVHWDNVQDCQISNVFFVCINTERL